MRKFSLFSFLVAISFLLLVAHCSAQEEKISITTYFPSPYGVFHQLQSNIVYMNLQDPIPECKREGEVFYDKQRHRLMICPGANQPPRVISGDLKTMTVTCNGYYRYVRSSVNNWGCTASCPDGWKILSGGHEFNDAAGLFGRYSTQAGNGWTCLLNIEYPQYTQGQVNWYVRGGLSPSAGHAQYVKCYAVCGKLE